MSSKIITREFLTQEPLRIKEREDGAASRTITGYAIVFGKESSPLYDDGEEEVREVILPESVSRSLLDNSDIKMTMFHDRQLILARSRNGSGTLSYDIDERGVSFEFEAPNTADGDKALELVRRGDIAGCSFAFSTEYYNREYVTPSTSKRDGKRVTIYSVRSMTGVYDFTLAADPAYPQTTCSARELVEAMRATEKPEEPKPEPYKPIPNPSFREIRELLSDI